MAMLFYAHEMNEKIRCLTRSSLSWGLISTFLRLVYCFIIVNSQVSHSRPLAFLTEQSEYKLPRSVHSFRFL